MKSTFALLLMAIMGSTSFAIPPIGAPSYEDGLQMSSSFIEVVDRLTLLNLKSYKMAYADKETLVAKYGNRKLQGCQDAILSRSGVIMVVKFRTSRGNKTVLFGTTEDPTQFKACSNL
jgi:hypothetical protein